MKSLFYLVVILLLSFSGTLHVSGRTEKSFVRNEVVNFQLKDNNYGSSDIATVNAMIHIYKDIVHVSKVVCDAYLQYMISHSNMMTMDMLTDFDSVRCRTAMFQSLRLQRLSRFNNITKDIVFKQTSGYFMSLSGLLSHLETAPNENTDFETKQYHVCVLAESDIYFYDSLIVALASMSFIRQVSFIHLKLLFPESSSANTMPTASTPYFLDYSSFFKLPEEKSPTSPFPRVMEILEEYETLLMMYAFASPPLIDLFAQYAKQLPNNCDFVLITLGEMIETISESFLDILLNQFLQETSNTGNNIIRMLNLREDQPLPTRIYQEHLFDWRLMTTWQMFSRINLIEDCNGFYTKSYVHFPSTPFVSQFLLGSYKNKTVSDSVPVTVSQPIAPLQPDEVIILITYTIRVFAETAMGLQHMLRDILEFPYVFLVLEVTADVIRNLSNNLNEPGQRKVCLQIAIGPHDITNLLYRRRYIAWHMEQSWSIFFNTATHYTYDMVLANALQVWMFSKYQFTNSHAERFIQRQQQLDACDTGKCLPKLHVVPMVSHQSSLPPKLYHDRFISRQVYESRDTSLATMPRILMYGSCSERRLTLLSNEYYPQMTSANITFVPACGGWDSVMFDNKRDYHLDMADFVLNLNSYNDSVLEVHRLQYLLGRGKCVLSERGIDDTLVRQYEGVVHFFSSVDEAIALVQYLAEEVFDAAYDGIAPIPERFIGPHIDNATFIYVPGEAQEVWVPSNGYKNVFTYQAGYRSRLNECEEKSLAFYRAFHSQPTDDTDEEDISHVNYRTMTMVMNEALQDLAEIVAADV